MTNILTYSDELISTLAGQSEEERKRIIFLEAHPEYPSHFLVNSFDPLYAHNLKDLLGPYRAVSMFKLDRLKARADEEGYDTFVFAEDPQPIFDRIERLNQPYPYELSDITLFPFQLQGFNHLRDSKSDIINWSTGAGKSVFAVAKAKFLLENSLIDKVVIASRNHNKINWSRTLKDIGELDAIVVDSDMGETIERREHRAAQYRSNRIIIINYEKFRMRGKPIEGQKREATGDGEELLKALKGKRVYFVWDEMPTKLANSATATYKGVKKIVGNTSDAYQSMLSATPLENAPEDIYSCVKILTLKSDFKPFTTKQNFRTNYAKSMNPWAKWQVAQWDMEKLQEMGMRLAHMTHQADKYRDPDIRAQFPKEVWEDVIIDMSPEDRKLYQTVQKQIVEEYQMQDEILSKLLILQLICNNPAWLKLAQSDLAQAIVEKKNPTDKFSAKLQTLKELLGQIEGKVVLFSMYNDLGAKPLSRYLTEWGISNVLYGGKQEALDLFKNDRRIKVFVSSDQGSDSINLQEATSVINYDLPWKYSKLVQRVNRINRITSEAEYVSYYNLIMAHSMEDRKVKILNRKKGWQEAIFNGEISDQAEDMGRLTQADFWYMITGEE